MGGGWFIDEAEMLAKDQACRRFDCGFADAQTNRGNQANRAVFQPLLQPGETILGMALDASGHLTQGAKPKQLGRWFNAIRDESLYVDDEEIERPAAKHRSSLIITGGSAIPRQREFARVREIADTEGALLLAGVAHFAGLNAAGLFQGPCRIPARPAPQAKRSCAVPVVA